MATFRKRADVETGAYGAVDGRVQATPSTDPLRFVLHDRLHGTAVACSLAAGHEELVGSAWGRRAIVEGWVERDDATDRAVSVTGIDRVSIVEDVEPGSLLRAARGMAPPQTG